MKLKRNNEPVLHFNNRAFLVSTWSNLLILKAQLLYCFELNSKCTSSFCQKSPKSLFPSTQCHQCIHTKCLFSQGNKWELHSECLGEIQQGLSVSTECCGRSSSVVVFSISMHHAQNAPHLHLFPGTFNNLTKTTQIPSLSADFARASIMWSA